MTITTMKMMSRSVAATALGLSLTTAALVAQKPALNVRMGLWEITSTMSMGGDMPGMDMSKLNDQQKAQMAAAMRGMMQPHVTQSCMTREKFDDMDFSNETDPTKCKHTMNTNTATSVDATVTCSDTDSSSVSNVHFDAPSPTTFRGNVKGTSTDQGKTMNVAMTMTGKWIGAACGTVK
jgi:Spy/CpxP family protein refolding chaperone